jgi:hypothetical protein
MNSNKILVFLFFISTMWAQTWQWTGRTHGELEWATIETEHFRIHHHQGIENIAKEGASMAEQMRPTLLQQMDLEDIPIIDIIFTTEDEIMNGFAMWTYTTFIWVDQNDAVIWLEDEKWLYQVLAHELQHIVFFHKIKTWMPEPWSILLSKTPGWVVEGLAEYETERWRPYRADISHKFHVLKNKMNEMDPHHDGYSKLLYWSERFGDSTIVKTLSERNKFGLFRFEDAFKKNTGVSVNQFNEDWRRHMNTYYYGYRSQKEAIEEIGEVVTLPIKKISGFSFYSDSSQIAISGLDDEDQWDLSLYVVQRDTAKENELKEERKKEEEESDVKNGEKQGFFAKLFGDHNKEDQKKKKQKPIIIWDKKEIDFGIFHKSMNWSPNGQKLVYTKTHFGKHQSLVNDIKIYDLESERSDWLTESFRASYPDWSPDGKQIVFVAHENSIANLYTMNPDGSEKKQLTDYTYDTQIINPHFSPNGESIVFAMADKKANLDLFLLKIENGEIKRITKNPSADYSPVWNPGGEYLSYTSHAGGTPNIHTVNITSGESKQISDVGDAVWTAQWSPSDSTLMVTTLPDVDTVRVVKINPLRSITTEKLSIRNRFTNWRNIEPDIPLTGIDPAKEVNILKSHDYTPGLGIKHLTSLVLPMGNEVIGATQWSDAMVRHLFVGIGIVDFSENNTHRLLFQYANAMNEPMWGISLASLMDFKMKSYDRSKWGLFEENSSISLWAQIPYNFGNTLSSDHTLKGSIKFADRNAKVIKDINQETNEMIYRDSTDFRFMPEPASGKEGLIRISYTWLNRRPHKQNGMIPKQGYGFDFTLDYSNSGLFGDFDYTRIISDAFVNFLPHSKSPVVIYSRIKSVSMSGNNPPPQDMPAITNDTPLYYNGQNILGPDEVVRLRGWNDWRLGDRLFFGTIEPRIKLGRLVISGFFDFGNAWYSSAGMDDWIVTAGLELRMDLFGFVVAYGTAQELDQWKDNEIPENYLRLSLVNPF